MQYLDGNSIMQEITASGASFTSDASARLRMSQTAVLGDYKQLAFPKTLILDRDGTGTATHSAITNTETFSVTAGQYHVMQTKEYHNYYSGKSQQIELTLINFQNETGLVKRAGYFSSSTVAPYTDSLDGFFLESSATETALKIYNNGSLIKSIPSTEFQNKDAFNLLDLSKFNIYAFDFLWLGGLKIRFFAAVNGELTHIHTFAYAGADVALPSLIFRSPNQPLRFEIRSTTGVGNLQYVCSQVSTEGILDPKTGVASSIKTGASGVTLGTSGTSYVVMALRQQSTYKEISAIIENFKCHSVGNATIEYQVLLNPTINNVPAFTAKAGTSIEYYLGNGSTITYTDLNTGYLLDADVTTSSFFGEAAPNSLLSRFNSTINGTMDTIVLIATATSNNAVTRCSVQFREL